jgi:hypothetical protein
MVVCIKSVHNMLQLHRGEFIVKMRYMSPALIDRKGVRATVIKRKDPTG